MVPERLARVVLLLLPLVTVLVSLPLALNMISRNALYGIRTARSYSSEAEWTLMNRKGGWTLVIASGVAGAMIVLIQARLGMSPASIILQIATYTLCVATAVIVTLV